MKIEQENKHYCFDDGATEWSCFGTTGWGNCKKWEG